MNESNRPLGITLLGGSNLFIRGTLFAVVIVIAYFQMTPTRWERVLLRFQEQGVQLPWNFQQFKVVMTVHLVVSLIFIATGWGLLKGREWARKGTLAVSFVLVLSLFASVVATPGLIGQAFLEVIYPGILIIYLTNRKVREYFNQETQPDNSSPAG